MKHISSLVKIIVSITLSLVLVVVAPGLGGLSTVSFVSAHPVMPDTGKVTLAVVKSICEKVNSDVSGFKASYACFVTGAKSVLDGQSLAKSVHAMCTEVYSLTPEDSLSAYRCFDFSMRYIKQHPFPAIKRMCNRTYKITPGERAGYSCFRDGFADTFE